MIDTILCINDVALQAPFVLYFRNPACKVAGFIQYYIGFLTFTTPPAIGYNRYLSLYNTTLYKSTFTSTKVTLICLLPWIFGFCLFIPALLADGSLGMDDLGHCGIRQTESFLHIMVIIVGAIITLFYLVSFICGYKVICKLTVHKAQLVSDIRSRVVSESKELILLLKLLLLLSLVSKLPTVCVKVIQIFVQLDPWVGRIVVSTFSLTSACNPYLTLFVVKTYRKKMKKFLRC